MILFVNNHTGKLSRFRNVFDSVQNHEDFSFPQSNWDMVCHYKNERWVKVGQDIAKVLTEHSMAAEGNDDAGSDSVASLAQNVKQKHCNDIDSNEDESIIPLLNGDVGGISGAWYYPVIVIVSPKCDKSNFGRKRHNLL